MISKKKYKDNQSMCFEDKVENRINRLTGSAIDPRHMERVPASLEFKFGLTYKIFEIADDNKNHAKNIDELNWQEVLNALYYLQEDALGGSGSRGYGKIAFDDLELDGAPVKLAKNEDSIILEQRTITD